MAMVLAFIGGVVLGAAIVAVVTLLYGRTAGKAAEARFRDAFAALSAEALSANSERFLTLARESLSAQTSAGTAELDKRKEMIDRSVRQVSERLEAVRDLSARIESTRKEDHGKLAQQVAESIRQVGELRDTTDQLRAALAHPQQRGKWGERMADDILQRAGMIEGVNYTKQETMTDGRRPDFTFLLGNGVKLHMDVKFPLDNYLRHLESEDGDPAALQGFLTDVRTQVRAIATREYINPTDGTADFALMFIPNERVFATIQDLDHALLNEAAQRRVLLVGPLSLLAVLHVTRQAAEVANLSRQTSDALQLIGEFTRQWGKFTEEMDKLGGRLDAAVKQYETVRTTRTNVLERPLRRLEDLRGQS
ncbi:MAG: DNA recombination protein RmuC [Planctomycetota bacterium]